MNVLTPTASGLMALTPAEAQQRIRQLEAMAAERDDDDAREMHREIERLRPVAEPESAYAEWGQG